MATSNNNISAKELEVFFKNNGVETQSLIYAWEAEHNSQWWKTQFLKADAPIPLTNGKGLFQMASMATTADVLFDPRASWSEAEESPKEGFNTYQGSIGQYSKKLSWKAQELAEFDRILKAAGGSNVVEMAYMKKVSELLGGAHATISNVSAQLLSKGQFISVNERGFKNQGKADLPAAAFKKAGSVLWANAASDIVAKMQLEEKALRDRTGYKGALSWKMDKTTFNYVMQNTKVQGYLKGFIASKHSLLAADVPAVLGTVDSYNAWVNAVAMDNLSIIEIVEEEQTNRTGQLTKSTVHGWEAGRAVLSPMDYQGVIQYAAVEELNWINPMMCQLAYAENGLISIASYKILEGAYDTYISNFYLHFAPALSVFDKMTIVDTTTIDS